MNRQECRRSCILISSFIRIRHRPAIFHAYMSKKFIGDPLFVVPMESIRLKYNLPNEDIPIEAPDQQV